MATSTCLLFRQLFERESSTYTYILACDKTKEAVIIDPVLEAVIRDSLLLTELGLELKYCINTHCHADHVTGTAQLKARHPKSQSGISKLSTARADILYEEGDEIKFGELMLEVLSTPGHTAGCLTYYLRSHNMIFTGDALLIRGCGRTDFQQGNSSQLYDSVQEKILSLPPETLLYPAHDYRGMSVTTVWEEIKYNPRFTKSKDDFVDLMRNLDLPPPPMLDIAVPVNLQCGLYATGMDQCHQDQQHTLLHHHQQNVVGLQGTPSSVGSVPELNVIRPSRGPTPKSSICDQVDPDASLAWVPEELRRELSSQENVGADTSAAACPDEIQSTNSMPNLQSATDKPDEKAPLSKTDDPAREKKDDTPWPSPTEEVATE